MNFTEPLEFSIKSSYQSNPQLQQKINEFREEIADGSPPQRAIDSGYDRAFTTILDANLTTFLVAMVLFAIGSGPVKGFAITLMIGIITSVFTAVVGTRALVNVIYGGRNVKQLSIGGVSTLPAEQKIP